MCYFWKTLFKINHGYKLKPLVAHFFLQLFLYVVFRREPKFTESKILYPVLTFVVVLC